MSGREKNAVSVPIIRIALVGVALGVCIMLFSIFIITGFKQEITNKLTGFSAHLNIGSYGNINSYASDKIQPSDTLLEGVPCFAGSKGALCICNETGNSEK